MDMHSGGGAKVRRTKKGFAEGSRWPDDKEGECDVSHIYIEAPEEEAKVIFYNRFGHNPERVTCTCCGEDYSISEEKTLEQATAYERHCAWDSKRKRYAEKQDEGLRKYVAGGKDAAVWKAYLDERGNAAKYIPLAKYIKLPSVVVIRARDIKASERKGTVPTQGYVWAA